MKILVIAIGLLIIAMNSGYWITQQPFTVSWMNIMVLMLSCVFAIWIWALDKFDN